jgi:hypothetical protein
MHYQKPIHWRFLTLIRLRYQIQILTHFLMR